MPKWTLPNWISIGRLAIAPLLVVAGWMGLPGGFLVLFALSLISDFVDGLLARTLGLKSSLGATLDTWGDVTMYLGGACGAWLLWPERIQRQAAFVLAALGLIALSGLVSLIKHRHLPSYHTWSAKLSTTLIGLSALFLFCGVSAWPFRVSVVILAWSAIEEIGITLVLPKWTPNVRTLFHAVALAQR